MAARGSSERSRWCSRNEDPELVREMGADILRCGTAVSITDAELVRERDVAALSSCGTEDVDDDRLLIAVDNEEEEDLRGLRVSRESESRTCSYQRKRVRIRKKGYSGEWEPVGPGTVTADEEDDDGSVSSVRYGWSTDRQRWAMS